MTAALAPPASRNAPCPCGSGKRYKDCHGALAAAALLDRSAGALAAEAHALGEIGFPQLARGQVDRHPHRRESLVLPGLVLSARRPQNPLTDGQDQACLLGERDEVGLIVPADLRFGAAECVEASRGFQVASLIDSEPSP